MTLGFASISTFAATLLISFSAQAIVLPNGTFVAQQCGVQTVDTAHTDTRTMVAACIGKLNGTPDRAVQFRLSDDSVHTFKIVNQMNLMMALRSGNKMSVFRLVGTDGEEISMKAILAADGSVQSLSGEFQTNSYFVPHLEQMLTMM